LATISSKKIRRQKIVGKIATIELNLSRNIRRFTFQGEDPMQNLILKSFGKDANDFEDYVFTEK
jgi:hypothetical protein